MTRCSVAPRVVLAFATLAGCAAELEAPVPVPRVGAPAEREAVAPADIRPGRQVRRLSAGQFHRSLEVVTGQTWPELGRFAGALGEPDLLEVTSQGLEPSVTFEKLVGDAARWACHAAVEEDLATPNPADRVIVREASLDARRAADLRANLRYLHLRFLGQDVPTDDPRLDPFVELLTTDAVPDDVPMVDRWAAVCVLLVTHPDFLTY